MSFSLLIVCFGNNENRNEHTKKETIDVKKKVSIDVKLEENHANIISIKMQLGEQLIRVEATIEMQQSNGIKVEDETFADCLHTVVKIAKSTGGDKEREGCFHRKAF